MLKQSLFSVVILAVLFAGAWLLEIGHRKLINPDEGRYSSISYEMFVSGDLITPRLNGLKYFEKPPLQYWATAGAFALFGTSEWSARLYTALMGLLCPLLIGLTGVRLFGREAGWMSALTLIACPYFLAMTGIVTLDVGLTFWTTLCLCAFLISQQAQLEERPNNSWRHWLWLAWLAAALAVLSKGLIGILFPAATIFVFCVVMRDFGHLMRMEWLTGLFIFLIITLPWFVIVSERNPEFARFFFIHEHFERFLTTQHRRVQPWWTFVAILFVGALPWAFMLLKAIAKGWRRSNTSSREFQPLRLLIIWSIFILVFFSISGSKLPSYILPLFPPLALVIGVYLTKTPGRTLAKLMSPIPFLSIAIPLAIYFWMGLKAKNPADLAFQAQQLPILIGGGLALLAGSTASALMFRCDTLTSKRIAVGTMAATSFVLIVTLNHGYEAQQSPVNSGFEAAQVIDQRMTPETRLYAIQTYDQTLPYYLKRRITLVDYADEFDLGIRAEPYLAIANTEDFDRDWTKTGPAMAIMQRAGFEAARQRGLPMTVLYENVKRIVVMKPLPA